MRPAAAPVICHQTCRIDQVSSQRGGGLGREVAETAPSVRNFLESAAPRPAGVGARPTPLTLAWPVHGGCLALSSLCRGRDGGPLLPLGHPGSEAPLPLGPALQVPHRCCPDLSHNYAPQGEGVVGLGLCRVVCPSGPRRLRDGQAEALGPRDPPGRACTALLCSVHCGVWAWLCVSIAFPVSRL